jgi:hypothetical protein
MKPSFWINQGGKLFLALCFAIFGIIYCYNYTTAQAALADTGTYDLLKIVEKALVSIVLITTSCVWFDRAIHDFQTDRIDYLEKKVEKLEAILNKSDFKGEVSNHD